MDVVLNLSEDPVGRGHPVGALSVEPTTSVRDVMTIMRDHKVGSVLVCHDGLLQGIFTERDVLRLMAADSDLNTPVADEMSVDPVTVTQDDSMSEAISQMAAGGYRRLPVIDDAGVAVGILKVSGIVRYLVEHFPDLIYTLPPQPGQRAKEPEGA